VQALRLGIRGVGVVAALALSLAAAAADRPPETGQPRAEDQRRPASNDFPAALKQALEESPTSSNEWAPDGPDEIVHAVLSMISRRAIALTQKQADEICQGMRDGAAGMYVIKPYDHPLRRRASALYAAHLVEEYLVLGPGDEDARKRAVEAVGTCVRRWEQELVAVHPEWKDLIAEQTDRTQHAVARAAANPLEVGFRKPPTASDLSRAESEWKKAVARLRTRSTGDETELRLAIKETFSAPIYALSKGTGRERLPPCDESRAATDQLLREMGNVTDWEYKRCEQLLNERIARNMAEVAKREAEWAREDAARQNAEGAGVAAPGNGGDAEGRARP